MTTLTENIVGTKDVKLFDEANPLEMDCGRSFNSGQR